MSNQFRDAVRNYTNGYMYMQGGTNGIILAASGGRNNSVVVSESSNAIILNTSNTERMRIASNGDIVYGVTPAYDTALVWRSSFTGTQYSKIYTTGEPKVYVISGTSGGVYLSGGSTSWGANSDSRLKNINSQIENAVEKLCTLNAVNFSWKSDETNKEVLGLIAQDVEKVFPQIIDKGTLAKSGDEEQTDKTEYLGVRYTELIPVLVKAIQELKAEIEILKQNK
jgi:hypothetical protein